MLWSSYYSNEPHLLPGVGDIVTYCDRFEPYTVERRFITDSHDYCWVDDIAETRVLPIKDAVKLDVEGMAAYQRHIEGTVYLRLRGADGTLIERERVEVLNWFPQVGDLCEASKKPWCEWQSSLNGKPLWAQQIPEWLYNKLRLVEIDGAMAMVEVAGKTEMVPFECLKVVEKDLGKAVKVVKQLELVA